MLLLWIVITPVLCLICFVLGTVIRNNQAESDCIKCFQSDADRREHDREQASNESPYAKGWNK